MFPCFRCVDTWGLLPDEPNNWRNLDAGKKVSEILLQAGIIIITDIGMSLNHSLVLSHQCALNTMRPRQNGRHFTVNPFKCIFTRGQLWPSGIVVACVCLCVCVCMCVCVSVNHQFVWTITCHPLKLQSPNLDQKCKTPWLRSLLFLGFIDLDLEGQIELKSQNLPHFGLVSLSGR